MKSNIARPDPEVLIRVFYGSGIINISPIKLISICYYVESNMLDITLLLTHLDFKTVSVQNKWDRDSYIETMLNKIFSLETTVGV